MVRRARPEIRFRLRRGFLWATHYCRGLTRHRRRPGHRVDRSMMDTEENLYIL